jgi:dCMP deaminase
MTEQQKTKTLSDWDVMYMDICNVISKLSYATDKKVGAIIVKDSNIISFSYNGTARGTDNNTQQNPVLHAEATAIAKVAASNHSTSDATLYCTLAPCIDCSKLIYSSGISRVVYRDDYKSMEGVEYLRKLGVLVNEQPSNTKLFSAKELANTGLL